MKRYEAKKKRARHYSKPLHHEQCTIDRGLIRERSERDG